MTIKPMTIPNISGIKPVMGRKHFFGLRVVFDIIAQGGENVISEKEIITNVIRKAETRHTPN